MCAWHTGSLWGEENVLELGTHEMHHCSPGHGSLYVLCVSLQFKKVCGEHSAPVEARSGSARPPEPPTHPHPRLAHSSAARCPQPPVSPCPLTELPKPSWNTATSTTGVLLIAAQRPGCSHHGDLTLPVGPPAQPSHGALGSVREVPQPPGPWGLRLQGQPQAWGGTSSRHLRTSWHQSACPHARLVTQTGSCTGRNLGQEGVPLS